MELSERGYLDSELRFGRSDMFPDLLEEMAYRRGLGGELTDGSLRLATKYGAPELSMSVKGLEMSAYDPRGMQGQGLLYATSNRGAWHMRGNMLGLEVLGLPKLIDRLQVQGKSVYVILHQNTAAAIDSLVVCKFRHMGVSEEYFARALTAVTGVPYATGDLIKAGERVWNLERIYNLREGFTADDDNLPPRLLNEPSPDGSSKGWVSHLTPMLKEYYRARGWDDFGVPKLQKLTDLAVRSGRRRAVWRRRTAPGRLAGPARSTGNTGRTMGRSDPAAIRAALSSALIRGLAAYCARGSPEKRVRRKHNTVIIKRVESAWIDRLAI